MTSYLKTMLSGLRQWITAQKADWSQNDETAANYIKGRPCYETDPQEVYLAKDETVTLETEGNEPDDWAVAELASPIALEAGKTYTVTWDGEKYSVVGNTVGNVVAIGNMVTGGLDDTGEPFTIVCVGARSVVYGLGAGMHTFSVATIGPRQIIPLPSKFLPDIPAGKVQGLASVATSGRYSDLAGKPTIPTDIVLYNTTQSLTDAQKTQARTNIGAGTSSFDGNYNNLTNVPCKKVYSYSPYIVIWNSNQRTETSPAGYNFLYKFSIADECQYDTAIVSFKGSVNTKNYLTTDYTPAKIIDNYGWCYWGNASLWSEEFENTGEEWCVRIKKQDASTISAAYLYYAPKEISTFTRSIKTLDTMETLDEELIPKTIQRTGDPVILSDTNGAKWRLTVGTDGTLSTEAVTE